MVESFIKTFRKEHTIVVVDPVMGDHGSISSVYTEEMCLLMRRLVSLADIVTPNLTEGCRLTDVPTGIMAGRGRSYSGWQNI